MNLDGYSSYSYGETSDTDEILSPDQIDQHLFGLDKKVNQLPGDDTEVLIAPIRPVQLLSSGKVKLPFDKGELKTNLIITNKGNNKYAVTITQNGKKTGNIWKIQNKDKPKIFTAISRHQFNLEIGAILNTYVSKDRTTVVNKSEKAYALLQTEKKETNKKKSLNDKPIDLGFTPSTVNNQKIARNSHFPELTHKDLINFRATREQKLVRCNRRKAITETVEERYSIPDGLLLAMMAHEGTGAPTLPNIGSRSSDGTRITGSDGGIGLIHAQPEAAKAYGLKVHNNAGGWKNDTHGKQLVKLYYDKKQNTAELCEYDDRRHPVLAVDLSARYLIGAGKAQASWTNRGSDMSKRETAIKIYHKGGTPKNRGKTTKQEAEMYRRKVCRHRLVICRMNGYPKPAFSAEQLNRIESNAAGKDVFNTTDELAKVNKITKNAKFKIGNGEWGGMDTYRDHYEELARESYGLDEYEKLGKYKK